MSGCSEGVSYDQESHVPCVIVHPEHPGGRDCEALTSHVDLIPTLVGLTGVDTEKSKEALQGLPGHDFSSLLQNPTNAKADAIREAVLFNYVGLQTVDALYMERVCRDIARGRFAAPFSVDKPDMTRRGFISFVYDGRYKFARYYAPDDFNTPTTLEDLLANNEIELFDLETDPDELNRRPQAVGGDHKQPRPVGGPLAVAAGEKLSRRVHFGVVHDLHEQEVLCSPL